MAWQFPTPNNLAPPEPPIKTLAAIVVLGPLVICLIALFCP